MGQIRLCVTDILNFVTEESTGVLKKAESEYKGHRSLLSRTRGLLSTMQRQDVLDRYQSFYFLKSSTYISLVSNYDLFGRVILITGFLIFSLAVLYVVSKRIGILKLQRKVLDAVKAGMSGQEEIVPIVGRNVVPVHQNEVPDLNIPLEQHMHDEL